MDWRTTDQSDAHPEAETLPMVYRNLGLPRAGAHPEGLPGQRPRAKDMWRRGEARCRRWTGEAPWRPEGNLARLAWERGWAGMVIHGAVRDTEELKEVPIGTLALAAGRPEGRTYPL